MCWQLLPHRQSVSASDPGMGPAACCSSHFNSFSFSILMSIDPVSTPSSAVMSVVAALDECGSSHGHERTCTRSTVIQRLDEYGVAAAETAADGRVNESVSESRE
jgi:hypothetical protein